MERAIREKHEEEEMEAGSIALNGTDSKHVSQNGEENSKVVEETT